MDLAGRTAVITGAGSGIGRALAHEAAGRGMTLALLDSNAEMLAETAAPYGSAVLLRETADVRDAAAVQDFARRCAGHAPSIALVFANAGILRAGLLAEQPADEWRLIVDVNVSGTLATITAFLPILRAAGAPARIVITGSQSSFVARAGVCVYSASKHALWSIAEGLKFELDREASPIGVSFAAPGAVATSLAGDAGPADNPAQHQLARALALHGAPPAAIARRMIDAAAEGRFWILPNPETKDELRLRIQRVLDESDPLP